MISLLIRKPFLPFISRSQILTIIDKTVEKVLSEDDIDIGILICSDEEIRKTNLQYRQIDRATDVLSFCSDEMDPDTGNRYLGDIIVSFESAFKQATFAGHDIQTEIAILLIHGFLHLLGFDHDTEIKKSQMWKMQFDIHDFLGISVQSLPGEND